MKTNNRTNNIFTVPFRRKREGRTYYKKRMRLLQSRTHRLVVRRSLKNFQVSVVEYNQKGDKIVLTVSSKALQKIGWKADSGNLPTAYLVGMLAGKKAVEKGVKRAVADFGFNNAASGTRLYAAISGAIDAGLEVPCSEEVLPDEKRVSGEHIASYAKHIKNDKDKYHKQFSQYLKKGLHPEDFVKHFNEIKGKING
jgi:large subunit ribosomal protein L18